MPKSHRNNSSSSPFSNSRRSKQNLSNFRYKFFFRHLVSYILFFYFLGCGGQSRRRASCGATAGWGDRRDYRPPCGRQFPVRKVQMDRFAMKLCSVEDRAFFCGSGSRFLVLCGSGSCPLYKFSCSFLLHWCWYWGHISGQSEVEFVRSVRNVFK